jgi:hypothetical protein
MSCSCLSRTDAAVARTIVLRDNRSTDRYPCETPRHVLAVSPTERRRRRAIDNAVGEEAFGAGVCGSRVHHYADIPKLLYGFYYSSLDIYGVQEHRRYRRLELVREYGVRGYRLEYRRQDRLFAESGRRAGCDGGSAGETYVEAIRE